MKHDTENYLIAAWLNGDHAGDLEFFSPFSSDLFRNGNNPGIVRMLKSGRSSLDILREYRDDYIALVGEYMPSVYNAAFNEAVAELPGIWARNGATPEMIAELSIDIRNRQHGIIAAPVIHRDLLATWDEAKEEQRRNGQCEYGIGKLDYLTGGIFKGHLIALAARPGGGKSALALQIASHVALQEKKKVLYFTLEMGITEQLDRLLMQRVGVQDSNRLKKGNLNLLEIQAFRSMIEAVERDRLLQFSTERIIERIESAIVTEAPYMIVIDQLTQLQFADRTFSSDLERYKELTRHLKMITNTTGITILLLCQLNRTAAGKEPSLQQLKDSGSIEEDSDSVLMIYSPPGTEGAQRTAPGKVFKNLKIAKQRSGTAAIIEDLVFDPATMTIYEYKPTL